MSPQDSEIRVFAFGAAWGLPTCGPFGLKLVAWLSFHEIPYRIEVQNNPGKGPRGKSPWAQVDGETIADSDRIIAHLSKKLGITDAEAALGPAERGAAQAFKTAYEERVHQVLEYELFMQPEGQTFLKKFFEDDFPKPLIPVIFPILRRQFAKQLHARGITRHSPGEVVELAKKEFEALDNYLADRRFICGDSPGLTDFSCFGQLAPMIRWTMDTPAAALAKGMPKLVDWCAAVEARSFSKKKKAA